MQSTNDHLCEIPQRLFIKPQSGILLWLLSKKWQVHCVLEMELPLGGKDIQTDSVPSG